MSLAAADGVILLIHHHDRGGFEAGDIEVENGVVPGFAADDAQNILGTDGQRNGIFESSVHHCRNVPGHACAARGVLAAVLADAGGNYSICSQLLISL
jgi:hypothetical protein